MPDRSSLLAALAAAALAAAPGAGAAAATVASFDDPAGDAYGPGGYVAPGDTEFRDGDFDLRRFEVKLDGDDVLLEVTLGAAIRPPVSTQRSNQTPLELTNGVYLQNVDVYVDTAPASREGFSSCIPGRRIGFANGRTWKAAIVLSPRPGAARDVVEASMGPAASRVLVARQITSRGRTLVARVPVAFLGGPPREDWGWSVQVSGARWERTYQVVDRIRGTREQDALTMDVATTREAWAFGGAPSGSAHPRVVDVLLPPGVDQRQVLGSFDAATGAWARVPFVYARQPPPAEPAPPAVQGAAPGSPVLAVVDVSGDLVTLSGPVEGLVAMQIGRVLGPDGAPIARLVVTRVMSGGLVATLADGQGRVARGAKVVFDPPAPAPAPARPSP